MELTEETSEPVVKQELLWNCRNDSENEDSDPLDFDIKIEPLVKIEIESNDLAETDIVKFEEPNCFQESNVSELNIDDEKVVSSSDEKSNTNKVEVPTGLLLYRLFNQIIVDALLSSPSDIENKSVIRNDTQLSNTQEWIDKHYNNNSHFSFSDKQLETNCLCDNNSDKNSLLSNIVDSYYYNYNWKDKLREKISRKNCNNNKTTNNSKYQRYNLRKLSKLRNNVIMNKSQQKCHECVKVSSINKINNITLIEHNRDIRSLSRNNNNEITSTTYINNNDSNLKISFIAGNYNSHHNDSDLVISRDLIIADNHETDSNTSFDNMIKQCSIVINKINSNENAKYYVCKFCDSVFNDVVNYEKHKLSYGDNKLSCNNLNWDSYLCNLCGELLHNHSNVISEHIKFHSSSSNACEQNYFCKFCDKFFSSETVFIKHVKLHKNRNEFVCLVCYKFFSNFRLFKSHNKYFHTQNIHDKNGDKKLYCNYCNRYFRSSFRLYKHKKILHNPKFISKKFACKICNSNFDKKILLDNHFNINHVRKKRFSCENCKKSFSRKSALLSHRKIIHNNGNHKNNFVKI